MTPIKAKSVTMQVAEHKHNLKNSLCNLSETRLFLLVRICFNIGSSTGARRRIYNKTKIKQYFSIYFTLILHFYLLVKTRILLVKALTYATTRGYFAFLKKPFCFPSTFTFCHLFPTDVIGQKSRILEK